MKKLILIITTVLAAFAFASCNKAQESEGAAEKAIVVKGCSLQIPSDGGKAFAAVKSTGTFTASSTASWLTVSVEKDTVWAEAPKYDNIMSRYGQLTIKSGTETVSLTVMQSSALTSGFEPEDIKASAEGGTYKYSYEFKGVISASTTADWIDIDISRGSLTLTVKENKMESVPGSRKRVAEVAWSLGADKGVINVAQNNIINWVEDDNWTVSYLGVQQYQGEDVEEIQNEVEDPAISGKYMIYYFGKSDYETSGLQMPKYIETEVAPVIVENVEYMIAYYAAYGYTLTWDDFLYEESDFEIFDIFDAGDYYGVAVGFDENGDLTGNYSTCEFKKEGGGGEPTGYEAWLGEWTSVCGQYTNTWTITAKTTGSTYSVSGLDGITTAPFEAEYDSSTGDMIIRAQEELGTATLGSYGECSLGIYGSLSSGNFYRPSSSPYVICTVSLTDSKTAQFTPGTISTTSGDVTFDLIKYIGTSSDEKYIGIRSAANSTSLTSTMTKNGGGGGGGEGSAAYKKWIGNWIVASSTEFVIGVSEKVADQSYNVVNWQGLNEDVFSPMTATFDSSTGDMVLCANTDTPFAANVSLGDDDDPFDLCYCGFIPYNGKEYYVTGSGDMEVGRCHLSSDSAAKITGEEVSLQGFDDPFTFCRLQILAFSQVNEEAIYSFKSQPDQFPLDVAKGGSLSSVKTFGKYNFADHSLYQPERKMTKVEEFQIMSPVAVVDAPAKKGGKFLWIK